VLTDKYLMIVLIVAIVMIASVLRARYTGRAGTDGAEDGAAKAEKLRMEEEMRALKKRIAVLERIATDRHHSLEQEIDRLRDS
jgi:hypothetical protein